MTKMRIPKTTRLYAIADIHGRADLLNKLLKAVEKDAAKHDDSRRVLVTLGDYLDRGPNVRKVIEILIELPLKKFDTKHLKGNHEDMFLAFLKQPEEGVLWLSNGGWATLTSYGFSTDEMPETIDDLPVIRDKIIERMPREHLDFLRSLKLHYQLGDYYFVHGGVRPTKPLDKQNEEDLIWIRNEFLQSEKDFGKVVVHGHSIVNKPEVHSNRIALDTGAFHTGKLTCLVLNGDTKYFLQADEDASTASVVEPK